LAETWFASAKRHLPVGQRSTVRRGESRAEHHLCPAQLRFGTERHDGRRFENRDLIGRRGWTYSAERSHRGVTRNFDRHVPRSPSRYGRDNGTEGIETERRLFLPKPNLG